MEGGGLRQGEKEVVEVREPINEIYFKFSFNKCCSLSALRLKSE